MTKPILILSSILLFVSCSIQSKQPSFTLYESNANWKILNRVFSGLDVLEMNQFDILKDKQVGVVTNHTGVNRRGIHLIDLLTDNGVKVSKIFTPEHGFLGNKDAGELVENSREEQTGAQIISLYGKHKIPTEEDMQNIDVLVFDIQDIGSRYYTYISTMTNCLWASAEYNIPFVVLDRPNPVGGNKISGPILNMNFSSFVGMHPIPVRHALTVGELAVMINKNNWHHDSKQTDLTIVQCYNWKRENNFIDNANDWTPPSPNIPNFETALTYVGTCLLEGTNISEGRGTESPFLTFGAPYIQTQDLTDIIQEFSGNGYSIESKTFTPVSIPGKSMYPKYKDKLCNGFEIKIKNPHIFEPFKLGVKIITIIHKRYPNEFEFLSTHFIDKLLGNDEFRNTIEKNGEVEKLIKNWYSQSKEFEEFRKPYLLY